VIMVTPNINVIRANGAGCRTKCEAMLVDVVPSVVVVDVVPATVVLLLGSWVVLTGPRVVLTGPRVVLGSRNRASGCRLSVVVCGRGC